MNKHIREFIKQTGGIGHDDDNNELTPILVGKDLEKFTELIVKECANISDSSFHNGSAGYTAILKHFGVV